MPLPLGPNDHKYVPPTEPSMVDELTDGPTLTAQGRLRALKDELAVQVAEIEKWKAELDVRELDLKRREFALRERETDLTRREATYAKHTAVRPNVARPPTEVLSE
jgi:hypothetical protein